MRFAVVVVVRAVACSHDDTRIHIAVTGDAVWNLDSYELRIADRSAVSEALPTIDLEVPDALAGSAAMLDVWGWLQVSRSRTAPRA